MFFLLTYQKKHVTLWAIYNIASPCGRLVMKIYPTYFNI